MNMMLTILLAGLTLSNASFASGASDNESLIRFENGVSIDRQREILKSSGLREIWRSELVDGLIAATAVRNKARMEQIRAELSGNAEIRYAEPNFKVRRDLKPLKGMTEDGSSKRRAEDPNDPMLSRQWALVGREGIRPQTAWDLVATRTPVQVKVAVIDTGVDATHPELQGRVLPGYDFIDNTDQVKDTMGHGTHVSGVIAAASNNAQGIAGIAQTARIIPIRAVPNRGDETDLNVMKSFEFAVAQGARVANCSFGKDVSSQAVGEVIAAAGRNGLLVIASAGNSSRNINQRPAYPVAFHTDNMIGVASTSSSGSMSYFSNYGLNLVDLAAPGGKILSTVPNGGYQSMDGTSMSSPQVTGVAALVLSLAPALTTAQVKKVLLDSVRTSTSLQGRVTTGGALDAGEAARLAVQLSN